MKECNEAIFSLGVDDFNIVAEGIIGRKLTEDEIDTCYRKFSIDSWSEYVEIFINNMVLDDEGE